MEVVEPLVSFTVRNLCNLLIEEGRLLGLVREKVEEMKTELTRMQRFLIDADRRRDEGDASVTNWVVEIRELAYDAEDVIATFVVKVAGRPAEASRSLQPCFSLKRCIRFVKTCTTRHVVGTQIQEINSKIAAITRILQTYGVQATVVDAKVPRITYSTVAEENVVGLQDDLRTVVAHLKDKTGSIVVSMWGIGGTGKTTFSTEILCHREVTHYFDRVAWVCVSQQCNQHQVWRDILLQFSHLSEEKNEIRNLTSNELVSKLHSMQMDKKCLVILDDIWKQEDWSSLSPAFPRVTETGSKIVLTTRNKGVLSHADIQCLLYELPFLKKEDCLELLEKKLALERQGFVMNTEMENLMESIVGQCGGLPLVIVLVGGLLAENKTLDGWKKVCQDLNHCFPEGNDHDDGVWDVLALSYQDLPYHLKSCFLYLSLFPEDHDIQAEFLVEMWIAEGFVSKPTREGGTKTLLDVGFSYLNELVNRCMVQANITKFTRRIRSIRLHNHMGRFCRSMAQEENFSQGISIKQSIPSREKKTQSAPSTCASPLNKIRRLAVYFENCRRHEETTFPNSSTFDHV